MADRGPKLTITYLRFSASAETFRLAAAIGKIPYTNKAVDAADWKPPPGKGADPRSKLPILEIEEKGKPKEVIPQRNAILHYLGIRGGLYPTDPLEGLQIEYMLDAVTEALLPLEVLEDKARKSLLTSKPWAQEELLRLRKGIANNSELGLPHYLFFFERALRENFENKESKWLVGTQVSIADLKLYHLVCWISGGIGDGDGPSLLKGVESSVIEKYPLLLKHKKEIETLPEVLSWRSKHLPPYSVFEHRPPVEFGRRTRTPAVTPGDSRLNSDLHAKGGRWTGAFPRLTLSYFNISGRAEPIRLAAAIGRVPFTNRSVTREDWADMKRFSPLGQLPTLTVVEPGKDLVTSPHSNAILRYIGKLGGLYPVDEIQAAKLEFMIETIVDALRLVEMTVTGVVKSLIVDVLFEKEEIRQIQRRVLGNRDHGVASFLKYFESVLQANKEHGWLLGATLSIADLCLYHLSSWLAGLLDGGIDVSELSTLNPPILDPFPLIRQHRQAVEKVQEVANFRCQHKAPYTTFDFVPDKGIGPTCGNRRNDNIPPRGVRRRPSSDGLPKNISRSKSADQIPKAVMRRPGMKPPAPAKRRSSREGDDPEQQQERKKTDKMMVAPSRQDGSFESLPENPGDEPRRKSRGFSMPPRARPINILEDEDDDDVNFSDESDNSVESVPAFLGGDGDSRLNQNRGDVWDNASFVAESFEDESSASSVERDLVRIKQRLKLGLEKEEKVSPAAGPAPYNWKKLRKKKKKKASADSSPKEAKAVKSPVNTQKETKSSKLPVNTQKETKGSKPLVSAQKESKGLKLPVNLPRGVKKNTKSSSKAKSTPNRVKSEIVVKSSSAEDTKSTTSKKTQKPRRSLSVPMEKPAALRKADTGKSKADGKAEKESTKAVPPPPKTSASSKGSSTPKASKKVSRLPSGSPRGTRKKKFPSNDAR